jgi:predicted dehydrogenase
MAAMGIHGIDAFIHLRGRIASVQAQSLRQALDLGIDDTTSMLLRFSDGSSGYLATIAATARTWRIEVFGTKGFAHMRDPETLDIVPVSGKAETKTWPETDIERLELEAFARAVAGGPAYPLTSAEAVHGIAVLEAIVTSAAEDGARVKVA